MNTINKTLLNRLFYDTDDTKIKKDIYPYVKNRIFPNSDEFIHFLKLTDMNEKKEVAKNIVKRLCMLSNYQPPYNLIINTLYQEKDEKNQSININYIPQDHFVHIVNTYIFGIYVYFEHPSLSRELNLLFSDKRINDDHRLRKINAVNDFISSWKSFCLYHDIGYPFEIFFQRRENLNVKFKKIKHNKQQLEQLLDKMNVFNDVYNNLKEQLTAKALAKLVVINSMIEEAVKNKNSQNVSNILRNNFVSLYKEKSLHPEDIRFDDYYELEDIYSFEHFKMFLGFIDRKDIMKILFNRILGQPIAFSFKNDKSDNCVYKNKDIPLPIEDDKIDLILNHDDIPPYDLDFKQIFELKYYIKLNDSFYDRIGSVNIEKENLDYIFDLLKKEGSISLDFKHINCESDLDKLIFEVFEGVTKAIQKLSKNFKKEEWAEINIHETYIYSKIRNVTYRDYIQNEMPEELNKCLITAVSKRKNDMEKFLNIFQDISYPQKDDIKTYVSDYINKIFKNIDKRKVVSGVVDQIMNILNTDVKQQESLMHTYIVISNIFESNCKELKIKNFINDEFNIQALIDTINKNPIMKTEFEDIKNNFSKEKKVTIDELIMKYKRYTYYDHGICSSIFYIYINSISSYFADKMSKEKGIDPFSKMLIPLFWTIDPEKISEKLLSKYTHIHEETFRAIFCHNIFADIANQEFNLKNENKWIIKIDKEPLLYFSMLCDSLQHWNREKYYDPRKIDFNPLFAMDSYNIEIRNDKIIIQTTVYKDNYEDVIKEFKYDDFLEDCSKYLSLEIKAKY